MEKRNLTCIGCPMGCALLVEMDGKEIISVTGNTCKKGAEYAVKEGSMPVVSVKTAQDIPKGKIFDCVETLRDVCVEAPVQIGDVILENVAGTGVDIVATGNVKQIIQ